MRSLNFPFGFDGLTPPSRSSAPHSPRSTCRRRCQSVPPMRARPSRPHLPQELISSCPSVPSPRPLPRLPCSRDRANVHPWFGGLPIDQAAGWTWEFFEENDVAISNQVSNKPTPYIAETGWPTASMTPENATLGGAVAGVSELQTFLNTYPCQANANSSYCTWCPVLRLGTPADESSFLDTQTSTSSR